MKFKFQIIISIFCFLVLTSCKQNVTVEDDKGNSLEFEITNIELTSSEKEARKDSLIIRNINKFLKENNSAVVQNYFFLCDTLNIQPFRDYNPQHKNSNINIHLGKKEVSIRPLPGSYRIEDGPFGQYKITDDSLGTFHSYVIEIRLTDDFEVQDYHSTLRFSKNVGGINRLSFKRDIESDEQYLIEEKKEKNNWW
ncbi:hypothetical protein [Croceimicrobium hydrocarbonivorans]|uniref:Lipoprotein n=1 Tax=Croceimicrobium hydrocarbonivorans TaxID=2761580 RepID=A0A7H0VHA6_9FLAO|nr:hypothetical protein [Croceimicrobium hydrocarbonivorans]QNR25104.1 hypothetical protein H4K34_04505 [Croceimicrobium hydrocarbonivorans]